MSEEKIDRKRRQTAERMRRWRERQREAGNAVGVTVPRPVVEAAREIGWAEAGLSESDRRALAIGRKAASILDRGGWRAVNLRGILGDV